MKNLFLILFLSLTTISFSQNFDETDYDNQTTEISQEGRVSVLKNTTSTNTKPYILFDGVPEGTIVLVENPMMERKVYAKVIGNLPKTYFTEGTIAMLSPVLAKNLGILDSYSFVIIKYKSDNIEG